MYKVKRHPKVALAGVVARTRGKAAVPPKPGGHSGPTQCGFGVVLRGFLLAETYSGKGEQREDKKGSWFEEGLDGHVAGRATPHHLSEAQQPARPGKAPYQQKGGDPELLTVISKRSSPS